MIRNTISPATLLSDVLLYYYAQATAVCRCVNLSWPPLGHDPFAPWCRLRMSILDTIQRCVPVSSVYHAPSFPYVLVSVNYLIYLPAPEYGTDKA